MPKSSLEAHLEVQIMELLLKELIKNGYPPESLSTYSKKDGYTYDLAIFDPQSNEIIAIFELKLQNPLMSSSTGLRNSIKKYLAFAKNTNIPFFLVNFKKDKLTFSQFISKDQQKEKGTFVPILKLPLFEGLKSKVLGGKRKKEIDKLTVVCWVLAFLLAILLVLEFYNIYTITFERISLIGAIIALILIPFAQKLKVLNFEFERKKL